MDTNTYAPVQAYQHLEFKSDNNVKVLRVINSLGMGGAERSIAVNVPRHIKRGWNMDVLVLDGQDTFFLNELKKDHVKIYYIGLNNNIYNPFISFKLIKYIKKYDIIHVHLFPSFYWVALAKIISFSKIKLVFTEHSTTNRRMLKSNYFIRMIDKIIYSKYDKIIAISEGTKATLSKYLNLDNKIKVIPNGIDINQLRNASTEFDCDYDFLKGNKKLIVQIASFSDAKDQDTTIKAIAKLPEEYGLILVGDGKRKHLCEKLARDLNVNDKVYFVGLQENIAPFISISKIVVVSSHWEGFGRAAIEGMAMRKPVLATNVVGLADIVKDVGLLFEVGDYCSLSNLIVTLCNSASLYEEIAEKCFKHSELFDVRYMIEEYENIYRNI